MADYRIDSEILTGIADAIRGKTNKGDVITPENMASEISSITTGGGENKLAQVADGSVTEITAEDLAGATKIREYFCYNISSLRNVTIPNGVLSLGNRAFMGCSNIEDVELPVGLNTIGQRCFMNCAIFLRNIVIPDSVVKIDSNAFASCMELRTLFIGSGITTIGSSAFESCAKMESVTITAETPPSIQSDTFNKVPDDCPFYVPPASVDAYKSATNWSARADYIFPILDGAQKGDLIWSATATGGKISWDGSIFEFNKVYFVENSAFNVYSEYDEPYPRVGTIFTAIDGKEYEIYYVSYGDVWLKTTDGSEVTENLVVNFYSSKE